MGLLPVHKPCQSDRLRLLLHLQLYHLLRRNPPGRKAKLPSRIMVLLLSILSVSYLVSVIVEKSCRTRFFAFCRAHSLLFAFSYHWLMRKGKAAKISRMHTDLVMSGKCL